jgi:hypothetical protein
LDPEAYPREVFTRIADHPINRIQASWNPASAAQGRLSRRLIVEAKTVLERRVRMSQDRFQRILGILPENHSLKNGGVMFNAVDSRAPSVTE